MAFFDRRPARSDGFPMPATRKTSSAGFLIEISYQASVSACSAYAAGGGKDV
jgi:hypothetical protein